MKKKVYISAYCNCNVGDDLFVLQLVRRYPKTRFCLFSHPNASKAFRKEPNLWVPSHLLFFIFRIFFKFRLCTVRKVHEWFIRKSDAVVKIGGSIFMEPNNFSLDKQNDFMDYGENCFYLGANFGPYKHEEYRNFIASRISKSKDCCFRDSYSYNKFIDLPNVRWAPDILFGCNSLPNKANGGGIGISVISFDHRDSLKVYQEHYFRTLTQFIVLCELKDITVTLFSFCKSEGDEFAIQEIISRIPPECRKKVNAVFYDGNINQFLCAFNSCEYIIATRFHAMVLGWCMNKKVMPVIYSKKQSHVLADIGYSNDSWNILDGEQISADKLYQMIFTSIRLDVGDLSYQSTKHFCVLDKLLKE